MIQKVFVAGATGRVGQELVRQIIYSRDSDRLKHSNPTAIVGLASSSAFVYNPEGIPDDKALAFSMRTAKGERYDPHRDWKAIVRRCIEDGTRMVLIDVTASEEMLTLHKLLIMKTECGVVTANKNPLAQASFLTFQRLTNEIGRYGFSCSVMAGAGAISRIRDLKDVDDPPIRIRAMLSGTLAYITSGLHNGRSFSDIVTEARELGYTEPHPASDLDGGDVRKKTSILVRHAGYDVRSCDISVKGFVPQQYLGRQNGVDEFMRRLPELDDYFRRRVDAAEKNGNVLRYISEFRMENGVPKIDVRLRDLDARDEMAVLSGTKNKVVIYSKSHYPDGYGIEAAGAGIVVTAGNIRRDLLYQLQRRESNFVTPESERLVS